ncbi:MAG: sulfatase [Acidobacteria bacterium]|nr:sulfatase [Acidobacteriota bacterium]
MTSRRDVLLSAAAFGLGFRSGRRPPNVVYIVTDDQRWDLLSLRGHPYVRTPNMDRIGREGVVFLNAFVTTSLCSPSRASILTGRYSHQHQVRTNGSSPAFDQKEKTFPALLRAAGYHTGYFGKWHIGDDPKPRAGFDEWAAFPGQGRYQDPPLNVNGTLRQFPGHADDVVADLAVEFLTRQRGGGPFCLCVGLKSPHAEQIPPPRLAHEFDNVEVPRPPGWQEDYAVTGKADVVGKACIQMEKFFDGPIKLKGSYDRYMKDFYRCVMSADDAVGRILESLDRIGATGDTLVVFTGDNGFFFGEHGLVDKRLPYEEALRVPMLLRYPAGIEPGRAVSEMALNIDLCPTVLDYCGVRVPDNVAGRSLRPLLGSGRPKHWRTEMFYDYAERIWQSPAVVAVRTERYKFIEYVDKADTNELYDLAVDPHENHNAIRDLAYAPVLADLRGRLERLKRETGWTPPDLSKPNTPCWNRKRPIQG